MCMYICMYTHTRTHTFFVHSPFDGHLGCFHILAMVNNIARNTGMRVSFWVCVFVFFRKLPRSGTAGLYSISIFKFWRSLHTSTVVIAISIPTNRAQGFPFLHTLANTYLLSFWIMAIWQVWDSTTLRFWFAFLWWFVMLNIFSRVWCPLECLLCGSSAHLLIGLFGDFFSFRHCVVWVLFVLWILISYHKWMLQLVKSFFWIYWGDYMIFIPQFVNVVYHADRFVDRSTQVSWRLISPVQDPWAGEPKAGLRSYALSGEPLQLWSSSLLWVAYLAVWAELYHVSTPLTHLMAIPSLYL